MVKNSMDVNVKTRLHEYHKVRILCFISSFFWKQEQEAAQTLDFTVRNSYVLRTFRCPLCRIAAETFEVVYYYKSSKNLAPILPVSLLVAPKEQEPQAE